MLIKMTPPDTERITLARFIFAAILSLHTNFALAEINAPAAPELIIYNAKISTQNVNQPSAEALAVRDGLILKVGDNESIRALGGEETVALDAGQRRLIPGLNDSHTHVTRACRFYNLELRWEGVPSLKVGLEMIREQAKRTPKGQWIRVIGGWSPYQFTEKRFPTPAELSHAAPDTPVFVMYLYSRGFLNQAGINALGITATSKAPKGSYYELGDNGQPTGVLVADPNPTLLYQTISLLPQLSKEEQLNSATHFYRELNRFGLTSVIDAGGGGHGFPRDYKASHTLAVKGSLPLRISYYLFPQDKGNEYDEFQHWTNIVSPNQNQHSRLLNGFEITGGGEYLVWEAGDFENFMSARPTLSAKMEPELEHTARLLVRNRWPFRIHATYDESITRILNVLEKINAEMPFDGLRWAIDHAETISPKNIARVKALGGGIAIQSRLAFAGEFFKDRYGDNKAANAPPLGELLRQEIPIGAGSDATRVSSYNPWTAMYWLVSGRSVGGTALLSPRNRLSREQALRIYTIGSAWFSGEERLKGRLAPGQFADFSLLDQDYFTIPSAQIPKIQSVLTVVGGQVVYGSGDFESLISPLPPAIPNWSPVNHYGGHFRD